jgi:hypothetical protein
MDCCWLVERQEWGGKNGEKCESSEEGLSGSASVFGNRLALLPTPVDKLGLGCADFGVEVMRFTSIISLKRINCLRTRKGIFEDKDGKRMNGQKSLFVGYWITQQATGAAAEVSLGGGTKCFLCLLRKEDEVNTT